MSTESNYSQEDSQPATANLEASIATTSSQNLASQAGSSKMSENQNQNAEPRLVIYS